MCSKIQSFFQIDLVGVRGTIEPGQFNHFHLLAQKRNFLPYNIYGGLLSDEFYIQVYGRITAGDANTPISICESNEAGE